MDRRRQRKGEDGGDGGEEEKMDEEEETEEGKGVINDVHGETKPPNTLPIGPVHAPHDPDESPER